MRKNFASPGKPASQRSKQSKVRRSTTVNQEQRRETEQGRDQRLAGGDRGDTPSEDGLLTSGQVADLLAISERTLWTKAKEGQIPQVKIGRSVRYDRADIREFVNRNKTTATHEQD